MTGYAADKMALYLNPENNGFGVAPSSDTFPTNYVVTEAYDIKVDLGQNYHVQKHGNLYYYGKPRVKGAKSGTVTFKHQLHGWSVSTPTAAPAALNPLAQLLKGAGLVHEYGGYGTENNAAASTTTKVDLDDASGWSPGEMILVATGASAWEVSCVIGVDSNDAYLSKTLSAAPAAGGISYGGLTFAPTGFGVPANYSLKLHVVGEHTEDSFVLVGCRGVPKQFMIEDGIPVVEFEFMFAGWTQSDHSLSDFAPYAYPAPPPGDVDCIFSSSAAFTWGGDTKTITSWNSGNAAAAAHTNLRIANMSFSPNLAISPQNALNGTVTNSRIIEFVKTGGGQATISYSPYFDSDHYTESAANAAKTLLFVWPGSGPGKYCGIYIPRAEVEAAIGQGEADGVKTNEVTKFAGLVQDSDGTMLEGSGSTEWANTAVRNTLWRFFQI